MTARVELAPVRAGEDLDWARLERRLQEVLPDLTGPMTVLQFPNGSANLTYFVQFGETRLVVRRPPFGEIAVGAHDMAREYRVLSRLHGAYDRAPRSLYFTDDPSVIGSPFLVSEYRSGIVVWDTIPESMAGADRPGEQIGLAAVEALADLHEVDYAACGLEDLGRPEGYLDRQLSGWAKRWARVAPGEGHIVSRAGEELARLRPDPMAPAIVHNDFKVDNCQFAPGDPSRVISVFDWDMATIGDPLTDFGTLLNYWPVPGEPNAVPGLEGLGLPTQAEVIERYLAVRGLDVPEGVIRWYEAFGCWKTAVILQQLYDRYLRGETSDPRMAERGEHVDALADRALRLLARG